MAPIDDDEQATARYVNADGTCGTCGLTVRACWCGKEAPPRKIQEVERLREAIADALNALEEREFRAGSEHAKEVLAHALRSQNSDR